MPRRSLESIVTKPYGLPEIFPEAPAQLSPRQKEIWKSVTLSRPADYFDAAGRLLLAAFCVHSEAFEVISMELDRERSSGDATDARLRLLAGMRLAESGAMSSLASRLRLSAQNRYTQATARTAYERGVHQALPKPWEPPQPNRKTIKDDVL